MASSTLTRHQIKAAHDEAVTYLTDMARITVRDHLTDTAVYVATIDTTLGMRGVSHSNPARVATWLTDQIDEMLRIDPRGQVTGIRVAATLPTLNIGTVRIKDR